MITFSLLSPDPTLAAVLSEYAASATGFAFKEGQDDDAAILFFSAATVGALPAIYAAAKAVQEKKPAQVPVLILAPQVPEDEQAAQIFAGVFKKPLRLAALLDTAISAWRLGTLRLPRQLSPSIKFDARTRTLEGEGKSVPLTEKEAAFLLAVLDAGSAGLTRSAALTNLWGYHRDVDSHAVETNVYRLRQKLAQLFGAEEVLASRDGAYCWLA